MKTMKIISAISLALILGAASTLLAGQPGKPVSQEDQSNLVIFRVNVHLSSDPALHANYLVMLVDDHGWLIAPPQTYLPGVVTYYFSKPAWRYSAADAMAWKLAVSAKLVPALSSDPGTAPELFTRPVRKIVLLAPGETFTFDLYPSIIATTPAVGHDEEK